MGITIIYKGTLTDPDRIGDLSNEIRDICTIMKWPHREYDDDWNAPVDAKFEHRGMESHITGNLGLKGIGFQPHPNSEWVHFCCDRFGNLHHPVMRAFNMQKGMAEPPVSEIGSGFPL